MLPLKGLKVINLSMNLPGPVLASQLVKLGATVTKIEPPAKDPLAVHFYPYYKKLTAKQKILIIDLKTSSGQKALFKQLAKANLLITSSRTESLKKLGLSPKQLKLKFPKLSHLAIVGYKKPFEHVPGHDLNFIAQAGLLTPSTMPLTCWGDLAGAQQGVVEVLSMVMLSKQKKSAQFRELALSSALDFFTQPLHFGLCGKGKMLGGGLAEYNIYAAKDGHIVLAALEVHFWKSFREKLKIKDATYNNIKKIFLTQNADYWQKWGEKNELPISKVVNLEGERNESEK